MGESSTSKASGLSKKKVNTSSFLSSSLIAGHGYITQTALEKFGERENAIINMSELKNDEDEEFVRDYIQHITLTKIGDHLLEAKTSDRSRPLPLIPQQTTGFSNQAQMVRVNEVTLKPEMFDGRAINARAWIDAYERAGRANDWNEATMVKYLPSFFTKSAVDWFVMLISRTTYLLRSVLFSMPGKIPGRFEAIWACTFPRLYPNSCPKYFGLQHQSTCSQKFLRERAVWMSKIKVLFHATEARKSRIIKSCGHLFELLYLT